MPKFILPNKQSLLQDIHSIDFRTKIKADISTTTFSTKSVYVQDQFINGLTPENLDLFATLTQFIALQNGQMVSYEDSVKQIAWGGPGCKPYEVLLDGNDFFTFLNSVNTHPLPPGFAADEYDKSLHFYLGKNTGGNNFNVVIVPAFEKVGGDPSMDLFIENRSFTITNPFFAYTMEGTVSRINKNKADCKLLIDLKDRLPDVDSATQVVSYSVKNFTDLHTNLVTTPAVKFFLQFGRVRLNGNLIIILSFLDSAGPIRSRVTNPATQGVCFDQGDLIPPPQKAGEWDSVFQ